MAGNRRSRVSDAKRQPSKRLNVQLREDSITRLMLHVVMLRKNPGDILSDLVDAGLRQYRVQENKRGSFTGEDRPKSNDQDSESEKKVA